MATVNDALKDLYLACGGDLSKLADNHDVCDYIRDLASVLAGGGGEETAPLFVDFEYNETDDTWTANKTYDDCLLAYNKDRLILFRLPDPYGDRARIAGYVSIDELFEAVINDITIDTDDINKKTVHINILRMSLSKNEGANFSNIEAVDFDVPTNN